MLSLRFQDGSLLEKMICYEKEKQGATTPDDLWDLDVVPPPRSSRLFPAEFGSFLIWLWKWIGIILYLNIITSTGRIETYFRRSYETWMIGGNFLDSP